MSCLRCLYNLFLRGIWFAISDILPNCSGAEPGILKHHPISSPQIMSCHIPNICAIYTDLTGIHIIESHQQIDDRCLTTPGRPDNRHTLTRIHLQIQIFDQWSVRHIPECYVVKFHLTFTLRADCRIFFRHLICLFQNIKNTFRTGNRILQLCYHTADLIKWLRILTGIIQEHAQLPDGNTAGYCKKCSDQCNHRIHDIIHQTGTGIGQTGKECCLHRHLL